MPNVQTLNPIRSMEGEFLTLTGYRLAPEDIGAHYRRAWRLRAADGRRFSLYVTRDYHWALYESVVNGGSQLRAHGNGERSGAIPTFRALTWSEKLRARFAA